MSLVEVCPDSHYGINAESSNELQVQLDHQQEVPLSSYRSTLAPGSGEMVSFHDIKYTVKSIFKKKKIILRSVSGIFFQGVNAVVGPTGSGKTSLLDILAGRKDSPGLSGTVLVNGERQPRNFKCIAGYVVQDNVLVGTLSVQENLYFSASLRLPSSTTHKQRKERVERVIRELGLQNCANTKIGTEFIRGISGGEKKRTNIGMELIIEPKVLFVDEPTTGVDANTAVSIVKKLKDLSKDRECIIIMSIHQPRYSIFKLFDTLTLLSMGGIVYHGPANLALTYFEDLGFHCEEHENPADYFLDVIMQCETTQAVDGAVDLVASYKNSTQCKETEKKLLSIMEGSTEKDHTRGWSCITDRNSYATNFFWQLLVVTYRSVKDVLMNPVTSIFQIMTDVIFALIVGILYFRLDKNDFNNKTVVNDRIGAIFFIVANLVFQTVSAIELFISQKSIFIYENISGYYRVSVFFFSKVLTYMILLRLTPVVIYSVISYFMIGFQLDAGKFFIFFLLLSLLSMSSLSLTFAISARVGVVALANLYLIMIFVSSLLFSGFVVSIDTLPSWLEWLQYFSIFHYAIEVLAINEISGQCYFDTSNFTDDKWTNFSCSEFIRVTNMTKCELPMCVNGTEDLSDRGFDVTTAWLWYDQIGLAVIAIIFLFLTYFNLRTIKKLK